MYIAMLCGLTSFIVMLSARANPCNRFLTHFLWIDFSRILKISSLSVTMQCWSIFRVIHHEQQSLEEKVLFYFYLTIAYLIKRFSSNFAYSFIVNCQCSFKWLQDFILAKLESKNIRFLSFMLKRIFSKPILLEFCVQMHSR